VISRLIFARLLFGFGVATGPMLSAQETRSAPTPEARQEVWQAVVGELRHRGFAEAQLPQVEDIDLPAASAALAGRHLRVSSVCWDNGPQRTQFRVECGAPGQCLPFLVYVHQSVHESVHDSAHDSDHGLANMDDGGRIHSCRVASGPLPAIGSHLVAESPPKLTVQTGDRATAVFLSRHMRMTASVICLQRGREGEVIRARAPDGHVFRARISGPALLEALPQDQ